MLSTISSVFSPLNVATPVMVPAKQIMQSLWHRKAPWDQPISGETLEKWLVWKSSLPLLGKITVPRWYFSRLEHKGVTFQLHHFCDASESGYEIFLICAWRIWTVSLSAPLLLGNLEMRPTRAPAFRGLSFKERFLLCGSTQQLDES